MTSLIQQIERVPVDSLTLHPQNARRGDIAAIAASLHANAQFAPIVVQASTRYVLAGNHTLMAARQLGWQEIDAVFVDVDDHHAYRIMLAANRTADLGGYDNDALAELLSYLDGDYEGTGYSQADVDFLLSYPEPEQEEDTDDVPAGPPPANPVTKPGDLWLLGPHRILCGDARDHNDVTKLLDGARINIAFTSPPYASQRTYDESSGFKPIPPDEYVDWFEDVQANVRAHLAEDGSWFVNIKEHCEGGQRHLYVKDLTIAHVRRWGWLFVDELAWTRSGVPGTWPNRFKNGWEPVFHFTAQGAIKFRPESVGHESDDVFHEGGRVSGTNRTGNVGWHGGDVQREAGIALPSNVIHIHTNPAAMQGADHPAAYPVDLPRWFLQAFSDEGDTVFDPFMGSGSTLIAADRNQRVAYGTEISPAYCDVICRRYQQTTSTMPILAATGQPHDFTAIPANQ